MKYDPPTQGRRPDVPNGDLQFLGLRMKTPRESLPTGYYARAENKRIGRGLETRPGTKTPVFANLFAGQPLFGSGLYSNPNGDELGLLALSTLIASSVVGIRAGTAPITIPCTEPFGSPLIEFVQHFDKVLAHGSDPSRPTFIWDGIDTTTGFSPILGPSVSEPGIKAIPNPPWSINFLDRAWFPIPDAPDSIGASDENDVTTYDADLHTFRVNTGTADGIIGAYPFFESSLIIGKRRSIDILKQIPQDLGDSFVAAVAAGSYPSSPPPPRVGVVSTEIGMVSRKAAIMAGGSLLFLSDAGVAGGIYQIGTDQHGNYVVDPAPVSEEIEPLIQRINWSYANKAVAASNGRYVFWFLPIDNSTFNNAAIVLNLVTHEWESLDLWNALPRTDRKGRLIAGDDNPMQVDNVLYLDYYGARAMFAVNNTKAKVHLLYVGLDDQLDVANGVIPRENATFPIQDIMETRAYPFQGQGSEQNPNFIEIELGTLAPSLIFDSIRDDADEEELKVVTGLDRSSYLVGRRPYDLSNTNDDSDLSGRRDYSVQMGDEIVLNDDGVTLQRVLSWAEKIIMNGEGRFFSFRVSNSGGICQVRKIVYEADVTRRTGDG